MKKRVHLFFQSILILGAILGIGYLALPRIIIGIETYFSPTPLMPEITYAEFPFQLKYEINGEQKIIEDTIICQFDGFEQRGEAGKYRKWKTSLKSGRERITLITVEDQGEKLELYFDYGSPEFYMNDTQNGNAGNEIDYKSFVPYIKWNNGIMGVNSAMTANEAMEKYKLKIIDWKCAPPIQNSFNT